MKNEHCVVVVVGGDVLLVSDEELCVGCGQRDGVMDYGYIYCIILSACDDLSEEDEN